MLGLGVSVRGSGQGSGLETPRVRNAWVRKGYGTKCLQTEPTNLQHHVKLLKNLTTDGSTVIGNFLTEKKENIPQGPR